MINKLNLNSIELRRLSNTIKPTYARDRIKFKSIHAQVQPYAVSFIPSVIDQWNNLFLHFNI